MHINIDLGSFATLRLITRYPTLNASSPETLTTSSMQSRKELVVKDLVGSVSQVIDLESKKIVERNSSEPFGLSRGIPLLTNAVLADYKAQGARWPIAIKVVPLTCNCYGPLIAIGVALFDAIGQPVFLL
ncbi:MAG: hypothetical protein DCC88_12215 [Spirobacillus cienkowskii]|uniref:Uncharacterized protein n=1 Tax=Spirobacillus cienkowskii TaxID=495820 RepID=A0A369KK93_9BACT|nr:MAG: hypothetical protein DCC88_12215 [Spirobacillus cienkowskii]